jgi:hypothetical protein
VFSTFFSKRPNQALQRTPNRCTVGFPRSLRLLGPAERRCWAAQQTSLPSPNEPGRLDPTAETLR